MCVNSASGWGLDGRGGGCPAGFGERDAGGEDTVGDLVFVEFAAESIEVAPVGGIGMIAAQLLSANIPPLFALIDNYTAQICQSNAD